MDENAAEKSTSMRDVIDETRYFILAETEAGWGVWDGTRSSDEPLVLFPSSDDAFELASDYFTKANKEARIRHGPWLPPLRWVALISGGVWIALNAILQVRFYILGNQDIFSSQGAAQIFYWMQALGSIANSVFLVAVGTYVLLWLRTRSNP